MGGSVRRGECARDEPIPRNRRTGSRSTAPRPPCLLPDRSRTLQGGEFLACARDRTRQDGPKHSQRLGGIAGRPPAQCLQGDRGGRTAGSGGAGLVPESAPASRKATACKPARKARRNARHQQTEPAEEPGDVPCRGRPERIERRLEIAVEKRTQRLRTVDLVEDGRRRASHRSRVGLGRRDVDGQPARRA